MRPPTEPSREDCCNSGCSPCIFDVYEKQLQIYKKFLECGDHNISEVIEENAISQLEYTAFVVVDNITLCECHNLLTLKNQDKNCKSLKWKPGQHFLFKYTGKEKECTRAYTPVDLKVTAGFDFAIIIKRYINGLVSNYLCNLTKGNETLWRGPYGNYRIVANKFSRIIMLAQGTGIIPFMSIIEKIISNEDDMTKIILFYCSQSIHTILFRDELYNFKSYWNFSYEVFLGNNKEDIKSKHYKEPITKNKLSYEILEKFEPSPKNDQFLICGSEQFMDNYKLWLLEKNIPSSEIILF